MTTMDDETEASVLAGLQRAMHEEPTRGVRRSHLKDVLEKYRATIDKALKRGHSRTALARILQDAGVPASIETIRAYMSIGAEPKRVTKAAKTTARAQRPKPAVPVQQEPESQEHTETRVPKIAPEPQEGNW
jgi:hypothetical protein